MRHGAGVFRHLLHVIEDDKTFTFEGIPLTVAGCGAVCVPLQKSRESPAEGAWPPCHPCDACFPADSAVTTDARPEENWMARDGCETCGGSGRVYDHDPVNGHACPDCVGGDPIPPSR